MILDKVANGSREAMLSFVKSCSNCRFVHIIPVGDTKLLNGLCLNDKETEQILDYNRHDCPYWESKDSDY